MLYRASLFSFIQRIVFFIKEMEQQKMLLSQAAYFLTMETSFKLNNSQAFLYAETLFDVCWAAVCRSLINELKHLIRFDF